MFTLFLVFAVHKGRRHCFLFLLFSKNALRSQNVERLNLDEDRKPKFRRAPCGSGSGFTHLMSVRAVTITVNR